MALSQLAVIRAKVQTYLKDNNILAKLEAYDRSDLLKYDIHLSAAEEAHGDACPGIQPNIQHCGMDRRRVLFTRDAIQIFQIAVSRQIADITGFLNDDPRIFQHIQLPSHHFAIYGYLPRIRMQKTADTLLLFMPLKFHLPYLYGYQRQRLAIAQATMEDQAILILDEPMNGIDKGCGNEEILPGTKGDG